MKLLVCDVEGTIFEPHTIKDAEHASYIWTKIADELGEIARNEEIKTHKKWREGAYGFPGSGTAYIEWVRATIRIHKNNKLTAETFNRIINSAPYISGAEMFFTKLNRSEYIPVLISGGIQNLNAKACRDLGFERENSFAACEYYFTLNGKIDWDLTFVNSCNFFGKEEIVNILLRKYGLSCNDWIFIGDGENDKSIAGKAPLSIGIKPVGDLKRIVDYSFSDFNELMVCNELIEKTDLVVDSQNASLNTSRTRLADIINTDCNEVEAVALSYVQKQIGYIKIKELRVKAFSRICGSSHNEYAIQKIKSKLSGVHELLIAGLTTYYLYADVLKKKFIASSLLQAFCNATETMMYITFILMANEEGLQDFISSSSKPDDFRSIYHWIEPFENTALKTILDDYKNIRNLAAHSYQLISIEAAHSFIIRTFENIQKLELLVNPMDID